MVNSKLKELGERFDFPLVNLHEEVFNSVDKCIYLNYWIFHLKEILKCSIIGQIPDSKLANRFVVVQKLKCHFSIDILLMVMRLENFFRHTVIIPMPISIYGVILPAWKFLTPQQSGKSDTSRAVNI